MAAAESPSAKLIPMVSPLQEPAPGTMPDLSKVLWPLAPPLPRPEQPTRKQRRRGIDVGAVITRALTAAGLMK